MKVMVYNGPKDLSISETPNMEMASNSVRIRSMYSGISHGTEMSVYRGIAPFYKKILDWTMGLFVDVPEGQSWTYPIKSSDPGVWYMGYSLVGEIIEKSPDVKEFDIGDIVYSSGPHLSEIVMSVDSIIKIPKNVSPEQAVVFTNLLTAYNGILDSRIKLGDNVVVSGLGVLGQLVVQMAKMSGATVIGVDMFEKRLEIAKINGADYVFSAKNSDVAYDVKKVTGGKGADLVIEVSGNQKALHEAIRMAAYDTVVTCLGWYQGECSMLNLAEEFHHNRVTLRSSQTGGIDPAIANMWNSNRKTQICCSLLSKLKLDNLITQIIPFENAADAYEIVDKNPEQAIQVVLKY
jgi:threonine dehydrogenase-like Zn-dependent dehydrogenase